MMNSARGGNRLGTPARAATPRAFAPRSTAPRPSALWVAAGAALGLSIAGCSPSSSPAPGDEAPRDGSPSIAVSLYPVEYLAARVGGEHAQVSNVVPAGAEPHDIELSPRDVFAMDAAETAIIVTGFQPAVETAAAEMTGVLDLAPAVDLQERGGSLDPHFWLDPNRMIAATGAIADALSSADPEGAHGYEDRADEVRSDLTDLDAAYRDGLADCTYDTFVTGHAAFGYLAGSYGLHELAVAGVDPDTEPSPAAIARVREEIRTLGLPAVFAEPGEGKIAEVLAGELDISTLVLDPVETVAEGEDYLSLMSANLDALREGLECR